MAVKKRALKNLQLWWDPNKGSANSCEFVIVWDPFDEGGDTTYPFMNAYVADTWYCGEQMSDSVAQLTSRGWVMLWSR